MTPKEFRAELGRVMPGYNWVVHKTSSPETLLRATGTMSSGFNRLSTLRVIRDLSRGTPSYEVSSAGYGTKATMAATHRGATLARALRALQDHYQSKEAYYRGLATALQAGRTPVPAAGH